MTSRIIILGLLTALVSEVAAYPMDGYPYTSIERLEYVKRVYDHEIPGRPVPEGAALPMQAVQPRLLDEPKQPFDFTSDPAVARKIAAALGNEAPEYGVVLLDISDPTRPIYAEHNGGVRRNIGSVGKLFVGIAWYQTLADLYPDPADRERLLHDTVITADEIIRSDHHKVMFFEPDTNQRQYRTIEVGDQGTLWEWMDWMLSASNNSAAATMQEQVMLLKHFGHNYPPTPEQKAEFFNEPRGELAELYLSTLEDATVRNGLDPELSRQGSFFTRAGKNKVPTGTSSYGNPKELVKFLYLLEQGEIVDEWSSRDFKRMLYMTQRRIRYASHPVLVPYAVYFKSGSLYRCKEEEGFTCGQYMGNELNLLASVATIEGPVPGRDFHYLVAVSSNVLRVNSAVAHQTLALRIHRMLEQLHAERDAEVLTSEVN